MYKYVYMQRNDPNINKQHNIVYKITNLINNKIYIGVHRTDNIDDGYMGSGNMIKRAITKYGKDNFVKEIIADYSTYFEALEHEKQLVTVSFINEDSNYNIREGGYGNCKWSEAAIKNLSDAAKKRWQNDNYRGAILNSLRSSERRAKLSTSIKKWINNNAELHQQKMMKINKNQQKIEKTAAKHRGMKRNNASIQKMSESMKNRITANPDKYCNKGKKCIHNSITGEIKFVDNNEHLPAGWVAGSGPRKNKASYKNLNKGSYFIHCPVTKKIKRLQQGDSIPEGFVKGRPTK